jgi:hypothetical protein
MNDKFQIFELMNNYILSIDSHNNEQFADNFTNDGIYESPWGVADGREAIINNINYWHNSGITKGKRHFVGAIRILEMNENIAKVESSYWVADAENTPNIVATGHYIDIVKKVDGNWKISHKKQTIDPSFKMN